MSNSENFIYRIRQALGKTSPMVETVPEVTSLTDDTVTVNKRAAAILKEMTDNASELMSELAKTASESGWKVARLQSEEDAGNYVADLASTLEARTVIRSTHSIVENLDIETLIANTGIQVIVMASEESEDTSKREEQRLELRNYAAQADLGFTGVDFAIAETGTCVLIPTKGVSRLTSLLPPAYVAIVRSGQVLPSLDELFTLRRDDFLNGNLGTYMSLMTGPSRSADIEYTLVTGVHGPGEVHMVLID